MGWFNKLFGAANGSRESMREAYERNAAFHLLAPVSYRHFFGLYGALATRYYARGWPVFEDLIWLDLVPFLLMRQPDAIDAVAEYALYQENVRDIRIQWLVLLINEALRHPRHELPDNLSNQIAAIVTREFGQGVAKHLLWYPLLETDNRIRLEPHLSIRTAEELFPINTESGDDHYISSVASPVKQLPQSEPPISDAQHAQVNYIQQFYHNLETLISAFLSLSPSDSAVAIRQLYNDESIITAAATGYKLGLHPKAAAALFIKLIAKCCSDSTATMADEYSTPSNHAVLLDRVASLAAVFDEYLEKFSEALKEVPQAKTKHETTVQHLERSRAIFACPFCSQRLQAPSHKLLHVSCPRCGKKFEIQT